MGDTRADRGVLAGGLPFNRIGSGPPVVVLQGLTFEHRALSGMEVRFTMAPFRRLAEDRSVYVVNRRPGLERGTSLAQMAADYAAMIRAEFQPPVEVIGNSSGGSIAFYLAAEHPQLVRRLVIQDCGCRLTESGRAWGREVIRLAEEGEWRRIAELMMRTVQPDDRLGGAMARIFSPLMARSAPSDPTDMIALLEAEDRLDFTPRLHEVEATTLIACGELDPFCGGDLAEETAAGMPDARALVYAGLRHGLRGDRYARDLASFVLDARREDP